MNLFFILAQVYRAEAYYDVKGNVESSFFHVLTFIYILFNQKLLKITIKI